MNQELKDPLALVKRSNKPAREVIEQYFEATGWSIGRMEPDVVG